MCPQIKGILKPISDDKMTWAHVICINWTPEIWFTDDNINKVEGKVPNARKELTCGVCQRVNGSCIQCDFKDCKRSYHVKCATTNKVITAWDEMQKELGLPDNNTSIPVFCPNHKVQGLEIFKQQGEAGLVRQPNRKRFTLKITNTPKIRKAIQKEKKDHSCSLKKVFKSRTG